VIDALRSSGRKREFVSEDVVDVIRRIERTICVHGFEVRLRVEELFEVFTICCSTSDASETGSDSAGCPSVPVLENAIFSRIGDDYVPHPCCENGDHVRSRKEFSDHGQVVVGVDQLQEAICRATDTMHTPEFYDGGLDEG